MRSSGHRNSYVTLPHDNLSSPVNIQSEVLHPLFITPYFSRIVDHISLHSDILYHSQYKYSSYFPNLISIRSDIIQYMASAQVNFTEQIRVTRKKIQDSFKRSHEALRVRENNLLSRVEEIETEFNKNIQEMNEMLEALKKTKTFSDAMTNNKLNKTREGVNKLIEDQITELSNQTDDAMEFEWDPLFETDIEQLGSIKLNGESNTSLTRTFPPQVKPIVPDYKTKHLPTAYSCKKNTDQKAPGELNYPRSLAIHYKTGNIYIADQDNHRVQVFSYNGDYLFMFCEKMNVPRGICISLNKVIVTQLNGHCMNVYEVGGKLVKSVGSEGSGEGQFQHPQGLDVSDRNNNIYVCDYSNNRVQIFTEDLKFHSMLGIGVLKCPRDVKVPRDRVLVLDGSNPCLFVFSSDHVLTNRLITRGKQTNSPYCFDIDREYNIIMSDYNSNCVYVFSQEGEQIHKFGKAGQGLGEFCCPYGIALDNTGRIIVVDYKNTALLQIF